MQLFHYHVVTSKVREVEARYLGKLGFRLVARYGRIGDEQVHYEPGTGWPELDELGFKLRLSELERGAVNVVVQPGQWEVPRVDHVGVALEDDEFEAVVARANQNELRVQEYPGKRTFIATGVGYRLEIHPQRDWIQDLLAEAKELRLAELHLRADEPKAKAAALMQILDLTPDVNEVWVGDTLLRFLPNGP